MCCGASLAGITGTLPHPASDHAVLLAGEGLDGVAVGGGLHAGVLDAAAHEELADGGDALLGEFLVDFRGAGGPVGVAVELDLDVRVVAEIAYEAVEGHDLVVADLGLVQVEEDVHVGALVDGGTDVFLLGLGNDFLPGLLPDSFGFLAANRDGNDGRSRLRSLPAAETERETGEGVEAPVRTRSDVHGLLGVEGIRVHVGIQFQVESDMVGDPDVGTQAGAGTPEHFRGFPKKGQFFAALGEVDGIGIVKSDRGAGADEPVGVENAVRVPSCKEVAEIELKVQGGLDETVLIEDFGTAGVVAGLPAVYGDAGAEHFVEAVADADLCGRGDQFADGGLAEVVGGSALKLEVESRLEFLRLRGECKCREKGCDKG